MKLSAWIGAFRLRTLPLALSTILLGSFLAASNGVFNFRTFLWAIITTLFLQILSNLANDLGDSLKGTDNDARIGPKRAVQSGAISTAQMKVAVAVFALLSLISGIRLLLVSFEDINWYLLSFFLLGILAIAAALNYTLGKKPYGYYGLGDLFVFIFFGIVGVFGAYYLHALSFDWFTLLPAISVGAFSVSVLNMNNMRDIENDRANNKRTLVVMLGFDAAKIYHTIILITAFVSGLLYILISWQSACSLIGLISFPIFIKNLSFVWRNTEPAALNGELKKLALGTLLFSVSFGLTQIFF